MTARPASQNPAPAAAAPEAATTARQGGAGYTLRIVDKPAPAVYPRGWRQAARLIGVNIATYAARRERGDRWCSFCRKWHESTVPFNGGSPVCKRHRVDYERQLRARRAS